MNYKSILFCALTICALCGVSQAQEPLSNGKYKIGVGGWIDGQYRVDMGNGDKISSMQVRRARLDVKGRLSKLVDCRIQADMSSTPKLIDAYMRLSFSPALSVQAGQFKIPFTLENILSPLDLELADNAQVISALSGYKDVNGIASYANGRDIGLMMSGSLLPVDVRGESIYLIKYDIGLFGGGGINVAPLRWGKDVAGRIMICPYVKNLTFSASVYWGEYGLPHSTAAGEEKGARRRVAAGIQYVDESFVLRGEYLWGYTGVEMLDAVTEQYSLDNIATRGCYFTASRWFPLGKESESGFVQKLRPIVRWDYYTKDYDAGNANTFYWAGVEWWPERHLRLQLAYRMHKDDNSGNYDHRLTAMTTVKF